VASGQTYEAEFRIRRADGAYRWHIVRALPIMDDKGVVQRWVGTNTDIEDQKSTAAMLQPAGGRAHRGTRPHVAVLSPT
jgi:PAS domain S-box-containing protein